MICTDEFGSRLYLTYILFKELVYGPNGQMFVLPKSICFISIYPIFEVQKQILAIIFERVVLNNNKKSLEALNDSPEYFL